MKWILSILFISLSIIIFFLNLHYEQKIDTLKKSIDFLKSKNIELSKKNNKLKTNNKILKQKNKKLVYKQKEIARKIKERRVKLTQNKLALAKKKLLIAPEKMIPIAGMTLIISSTAYDIYTYCEEIKDMKKFENSLFSIHTPIKNNYAICGINVENKLNLIKNNINIDYNKFIHSISKEYDITSNYWKEKTNTFAQEVDKNNKQIINYWLNKF